MESLPKEVINDILQFNKYPHEVYKITYFAVCLGGGGIEKLTSFYEVVNDREGDGNVDMDLKSSTIRKSFLNKILSKELPHYFESSREEPIDCVGYYGGNFDPIIHKIIRIN